MDSSHDFLLRQTLFGKAKVGLVKDLRVPVKHFGLRKDGKSRPRTPLGPRDRGRHLRTSP